MENQINKVDAVYVDMFCKGFNDSNISLLYYYIYEHDFIYDPDSKNWYFFNKYGIYEKDLSNIYFYKKYNDLYDLIEKKYTKMLKDEIDEGRKALILKCFKSGFNYIKKNKTKENILNECKIHYAKKNISDKFNNVNGKIIGFKNGVYDLEKNEFRKGKPEEYVTLTTKYNYVKSDKSDIDKLYKLLRDIIPNEEELKYVLKTLSLSLINDNPLEEFYIWIGTGGNGKGVMSTLLQEMLGEYCGTLSIEYLIKSKGEMNHHSNSADPQMASLRYSRLVISTEPEGEGEVRLRSAKLKQISGRDTIKTRLLRENCFEFVPKFKLIIQTNFLPQIDGTDGGIKRRLRFIRYRRSFVENPTKSYEVKGDPEIKNLIKTDKYRLALFEILKEHYYLYIKEGIKVPKHMQDETTEYLEDNDPVQPFIINKIDKTDNSKDRILVSKMYDEFKKFVNNNTNGFNSSKFKTTMENKGFIIKKIGGMRYYMNCKIKEDDEDNDNIQPL